MSRHFREQNWFVENHVSHGNKHYTMFFKCYHFLGGEYWPFVVNRELDL